MMSHKHLKIPISDYKDCASDFEKNVIPHIDKIYLLSLLMHNSKWQAARLTKSVFIKAFRFYPLLDRSINREDWLFRIWVNHYLEKYSNAERFFESAGDLQGKTIAQKSIENLSIKKTLDFVFSLPEFSRLALILNDVLQKSFFQIASYTGYPADYASESALKSRMVLGIKDAENTRFLYKKFSSLSAPRRFKKLIKAKTFQKFISPNY